MKYILIAVMLSFLALFAGTGCDDNEVENATETVADDSRTDAETVDQELVGDVGVVPSDAVAAAPDTATLSEVAPEEADSSHDPAEVLPGDVTEAPGADSE